jgi:hypothetical protein
VAASGSYVYTEVRKCTGVELMERSAQIVEGLEQTRASPVEQGRTLTAQAQHVSCDGFVHSHQCSVWQGSWEGLYCPQEEARHAQRLKAYVQAAGRRAAQQAPAVASLLKEMLELGNSE